MATLIVGLAERALPARPLTFQQSAPMATIDTYRKQAKQLLRWHRERNYSVGGKFRLLDRYRHLSDVAARNTPLPLAVAQEIAAAAFYSENLGFHVDFLHGRPPFYGSVSRGHSCLYLRFVHEPNSRLWRRAKSR